MRRRIDEAPGNIDRTAGGDVGNVNGDASRRVPGGMDTRDHNLD
jgi:hypothetical protein